MASGAKVSTWSRNTTAEIERGDDASSSAAAPLAAKPSGDSDGVQLLTKAQLVDLLRVSLRPVPGAVMIAETSERSAAPILRAASRGTEEMYERSQLALLGDSGCCFDAPDFDLDVAAKLYSVRKHGGAAAVVQTQRRASGDLFKAFQYHRGLNLGSDSRTTEEVWLLLTVSFDITAEFEHELEGQSVVDYDFYKEAAISIAEQARSRITKAILESFRLRSDAFDAFDEDSTWSSEDSDDDLETEHELCISITTPEWVEYPSESTDIRRP